MNLKEELSSAYPGFAPGSEARQAAQNAIGSRIEQVRRTKRIRRSCAVAALTLTSIAVFVGVGPTAWAVYNLHRIEGSVSDAKTAEIDEFGVNPDGTTSPTGRALYDHGKWRLESGSSYQIWGAGKLWQFDTELKRVTVRSAPEGPFSYNPSGFSVRSMIADMTRWSWKQKIEIGEGVFDGAQVSKVTITNSNGVDRIVLLADRTTSMPLAFRFETNSVNGWRLRSLARAKFDKPLDQGLFSTRFDASTPIVDLDTELVQFKSRIQTPLATLPWHQRTIAIRSIDINPNGDIFVLFTDGETKHDRQRQADALIAAVRHGNPNEVDLNRDPQPGMKATDSLGDQYLKSGEFQPYVASASEQFRSGVVLQGGQVLQGAWFIPERVRPWCPISITLSLNGGTGFIHKFPKITSPIVPDWAPLMAMGPRSDEDVLRGELVARRTKLEGESNYIALAANILAELDLDRKDESQGKGPWAKGNLYFGLYIAYTELGDHKSAVRYLRLAADESDAVPGLKEAMQREHLP